MARLCFQAAMRKRAGGIMRGVSKADLPEKICLVCQRPFRWRKRWAAVWDEVLYCSQRCRQQRTAAASAVTAQQNAGPG